MAMRAQIYNAGTGGLYEVTEATRIITSPGPKWSYTLRPVLLEYASGDVKPYSGTAETITGYNVWELNNTTTVWFGLDDTEYQGLEFEPVPTGSVVLASAPAEPMVDSNGDPVTDPGFWLVFQYPNQLAGDCT